MSNLAALLKRVKALEEGNSEGVVFLTLANGMRYRTTSKKMLKALQVSSGDPTFDEMMQAKGCSDGSRLWELLQAIT